MRTNWNIQPQALIIAALWILILPPAWIAAAFSAAVIHECAHILAIRFFSGRICDVTVSPWGAAISVGPLSPLQELICAAAGPAASFSLLALSRFFPLAALAGFVQGMFNLLPIYPSDGARILKSLFLMLWPSRADNLLRWAGILTAGVILLMGTAAVTLLKVNFALVGACIFLILRPLAVKIPCKERPLRVQ